MKDNLDIDDLLAEINSSSNIGGKNSKGGKKKQKQKDTTDTSNPEESLNTKKIVEVFETIKLGNPAERDKNIQDVLTTQEDDNEGTINLESVVEIVDPEKAKKKKKRSKKKKTNENAVDVIGGEKEVSTNLEEQVNKFKQYFDFSDKNITDSRFQDNSVFRILKNWEEKEWRQTY
jgi:hypothetical protein